MMTAHIYPGDQIFIRYNFATELFIGQHECFFACSGRIDLGIVLWGDSWKIYSAFQMVMLRWPTSALRIPNDISYL